VGRGARTFHGSSGLMTRLEPGLSTASPSVFGPPLRKLRDERRSLPEILSVRSMKDCRTGSIRPIPSSPAMENHLPRPAPASGGVGDVRSSPDCVRRWSAGADDCADGARADEPVETWRAGCR
jgi:hypothetical protein